MKAIGSQTIHTPRLILRPPELTDAADLVRIKSLAMSMDEARTKVADMVQERKHPFSFHWVITLNGAVIGRIKGWEVSPYNGYLQLGYDIAPKFRNHGYMTEAAQAVVLYLLKKAEANRVYCSVRASNPASRRVCEKIGMIHEGTLRQHYARQDGGYDDVCIYGVVRSDL